MLQDMMEGESYLVLAVLVFIAVLLLLEGLWSFWQSHRGPRAARLRRRLADMGGAPRQRAASARLLKDGTVSHLPVLERLLARQRVVVALERLVLQSGLRWTVSRLLLTCALGGVAAWMGMAVGLHQSATSCAIAAAAGALLPLMYVRWRRERRLARIGQQLPEALDLMTRALRAGHAFSSGLKMAGEEMAEPVAGEFRAVHEEITYGVSMQQALAHLAERVPSTDLRYFVVAVLIQRESGGNLTEILSKLSQLIRQRARLLARVRVLSSEGRMSAWILTLLPFALGGVLYLTNPKFMGPMFTDPIGIAMTQYLLVMMAIGVVVLRRIVRIRY